MKLADRLTQLLDDLPGSWNQAGLDVVVAEPAQADRAAALLASLSPGRSGAAFRLRVSSTGIEAPSVDATARMLTRLDEAGIDARIAAVAEPLATAGAQATTAPSLARAWDELAARLPRDWSDIYLELELVSSDDVQHVALLAGPVNPLLFDGVPPRMRFRAAHRFGYGVSPQMLRRCLARLDEAGIAGALRLRRVLCDTEPVLTQGPVWREGGRAI